MSPAQSKRSTSVIRKNMLLKNGIFLKCKQPSQGTKDKQMIQYYQSMENHGFLVTKTGCIFAYDNYYTGSKGRPKAHKISYLFFKGDLPQPEPNSHGWPTKMQVTHLCHRKKCINPNHLIAEEQWKNLKRNYCGINGECDCNMQPPCIRTYHSDNWDHEDEFVGYDGTSYIKRLLLSMLPGYEYTLLPRDHFDAIDRRIEARNAIRRQQKVSRSLKSRKSAA
jgi:hypothetical protein